jgi:Uma2 family endonuclease
MSTKMEATIEDLKHIPDNAKAEIVNGEIIFMSPTGHIPMYAGGEIFASLRQYAKRKKIGYAVTDNAGFAVNLPHRKSFSPDVAFQLGKPVPGYVTGAPVFAVEIRSENDYGAIAEAQIAAKRADYFATGTLVVWDVDVLRDKVVRVYRGDTPDKPSIYRRGEIAEAEPAVPGWKMRVDEIFPY